MTKDEKIKMKMLELELAMEKAYRTMDKIHDLGERAKLVIDLTPELKTELKPWK